MCADVPGWVSIIDLTHLQLDRWGLSMAYRNTKSRRNPKQLYSDTERTVGLWRRVYSASSVWYVKSKTRLKTMTCCSALQHLQTLTLDFAPLFCCYCFITFLKESWSPLKALPHQVSSHFYCHMHILSACSLQKNWKNKVSEFLLNITLQMFKGCDSILLLTTLAWFWSTDFCYFLSTVM